MKAKINLLWITMILTIIVFVVSTYWQKQLIHYEATVPCLVLTKDLLENELVRKEDVRQVNMPISIVATQKIVTQWEEIEGLYTTDNIKASQIAIRSQFDTKENLSVYEAEAGKEKIAIKIKNAENGMAFQIKEKAHVHVYATLRNEYANGFLPEKERLVIGDEYDGYTILKLLDDVEVLGVFTLDGMEYEKTERENIDSILIAVTSEEARTINLIREIASFNVTGISIPRENAEVKENQELLEENSWSGEGR